MPIGGAIPGFVSAALVPHYGWPILFFIGGVVPIVIAVAALFGMPESIKYMTLHPRERHKMEALVAASVAALTVYDMCKALDKGIVIEHIRLDKKSGGKSGTYSRKPEKSQSQRRTGR